MRYRNEAMLLSATYPKQSGVDGRQQAQYIRHTLLYETAVGGIFGGKSCSSFYRKPLSKTDNGLSIPRTVGRSKEALFKETSDYQKISVKTEKWTMDLKHPLGAADD